MSGICECCRRRRWNSDGGGGRVDSPVRLHSSFCNFSKTPSNIREAKGKKYLNSLSAKTYLCLVQNN